MVVDCCDLQHRFILLRCFVVVECCCNGRCQIAAAVCVEGPQAGEPQVFVLFLPACPRTITEMRVLWFQSLENVVVSSGSPGIADEAWADWSVMSEATRLM